MLGKKTCAAAMSLSLFSRFDPKGEAHALLPAPVENAAKINR